MNADIKAKWLEALRSNNYKQTQHALKDERGHCVMGVLCDLYEEATGEEGFGDYDEIPSRVLAWAGLPNSLEVKYAGGSALLYELNDNAELDFLELADLIEASL